VGRPPRAPRHAAVTAPQPPAPANMPPLAFIAPTLLGSSVSTAHADDGTPFVMIRFESPTGSFVALLPPENARALGQSIVDEAGGATSALVVPTGPLIVPR
jgi:hypothetical protein